jgi:hypothetical protein
MEYEMYKTIEKESLRWYYNTKSPSILFPSCTTVIGYKDKLFGKWKNSRPGDAANFGTSMHFQIEKYIYDKYNVGNPEDMGFPHINIWNLSYQEGQEKIKKVMRMFFEFEKEHPDYYPLLQELALFYDKNNLKFAGRIDQYVRLDGKNTLLDLKTGGYWPEYDYQLAGYFILLSQFENVEQVVCLYLDSNEVRNPTKKYKLHKYSIEEIITNSGVFMNKLKEFHSNNIWEYINEV